MMLIDHILLNTTHLLIMLFLITLITLIMDLRLKLKLRFDSLFLLDAGLGSLRGFGLPNLAGAGVGAAAIGLGRCSLLTWSFLGRREAGRKSALVGPAQLLLDLAIASGGCLGIAEARLLSNDIPVNLQEILSALSGKVSYRERVVNERPLRFSDDKGEMTWRLKTGEKVKMQRLEETKGKMIGRALGISGKWKQTYIRLVLHVAEDGQEEEGLLRRGLGDVRGVLIFFRHPETLISYVSRWVLDVLLTWRLRLDRRSIKSVCW
jgi:hypothetical protein